jgi:hypothetical protein
MIVAALPLWPGLRMLDVIGELVHHAYSTLRWLFVPSFWIEASYVQLQEAETIAA